jgi:hypothetical protein
MSKVSDMIVNMILKKGVMGEFRNFETKVDIPQESGEPITVTIKAEHLQVRLEKSTDS